MAMGAKSRRGSRLFPAFCTVAIGFGTLFGMEGGAFALQAGGVEIGDFETGSVVGQPFKELEVDVRLMAVEIGSVKTWYPPATVIDFRVRPGRPVLIKVANNSTVERGFQMEEAGHSGAPTALKAQVMLKPGETKYIGIPTSDLTYAGQGLTLTYRDPLHPNDPGGVLLMIK
ncbi:MAG: hypothetical protein NNA20_06830 [Nitrospira sp.]|nr:hypothetical protein [Nitrospira sp.]MCP9442291.1 hypothetical protein [Nitrospira sp.]